MATGLSPAAAPVADNSDDGTDPDPNGNGDPTEAGEDDPTSIGFIELPVVGVAKEAGVIVENGDSTFTVPMTVTVENLGNVPLASLQVTDNLATTFPAPATFATPIIVASASLTPNAGYDGDADSNLLDGSDSLAVGATATITFSITFTPNGEAGPFMNQASASAISPAAAPVGDDSDNGTAFRTADYIFAQYCFHIVKVMRFYTCVILAEHVYLRRGDASVFQLLFDEFQVVEVITDVVMAFHTAFPCLSYAVCVLKVVPALLTQSVACPVSRLTAGGAGTVKITALKVPFLY